MRRCMTCSSYEICESCKGANREIPSCICKEGYYDDGINDDCV